MPQKKFGKNRDHSLIEHLFCPFANEDPSNNIPPSPCFISPASHKQHTSPSGRARLPQTPGLTLRLEQAQNVVLANCCPWVSLLVLMLPGVPSSRCARIGVSDISYLGP